MGVSSPKSFGAGRGDNAEWLTPPFFSAGPGRPAKRGVLSVFTSDACSSRSCRSSIRGASSPARSNAARISSIRHSASFLSRITPALICCCVANAATEVRAFSTRPSETRFWSSSAAAIMAMRCLSTPISSRAAAIAAVAAFCAFKASNSRRRESRSAKSFSLPASAASSSAAAARVVVSARDSFCAATARRRAFSSAHSFALFSPCAISASSAASALSARRMAFCTTRSTSRRALSNHAPRLSSNSTRIESASARASRSSVSLSFKRIKNTMLSAVSFATASL